MIVLTEHWLKASELDMCTFPNYELANAFNRTNQIGGGVAILIRRGLDLNITKLPSIQSQAVEQILEVTAIKLSTRDFSITIIGIYRSPISMYNNVFLDKFQDLLLKLKKGNCAIFGDFNVNILSQEKLPNDLKQLVLANQFEYIFCEPTRITSHSETCIDNCLTNSTELVYESQVIQSNISDHSAQTVSLKIPTALKPLRYKTENRLIKETSL